MQENSTNIQEIQPQTQPKPKRAYTKRQPVVAQSQPNIPNPNISSLESELLPLIRRKMELESGLILAQNKANQANSELQQFQAALSQITSQVQYIQQVIAQMKGIPFSPEPSFMTQQTLQGPPQYQAGLGPARFADYPQAVQPSPMYTPAAPYPVQPFPPQPAVGSFPAPNRGLYPDATSRVDETGIEYNEGPAVREPMSVLEGRYER